LENPGWGTGEQPAEEREGIEWVKGLVPMRGDYSGTGLNNNETHEQTQRPEKERKSGARKIAANCDPRHCSTLRSGKRSIAGVFHLGKKKKRGPKG